MNFIQEYIFEIFDSDEIIISKGTTEVTLEVAPNITYKYQHLCDGSFKEKKDTQSEP